MTSHTWGAPNGHVKLKLQGFGMIINIKPSDKKYWVDWAGLVIEYVIEQWRIVARN